jgi:hypothetical protein
MRAYYAGILGISANAGEGEIKSAYRRLAKRYHPDVNKDPGAREKFLEIRKAYDFLTKMPGEAKGPLQTAEEKKAEEQRIMREKRRKAAEKIKRKREEEEAEAWRKFKQSGVMWVLIFGVLTTYFVLMGVCVKNITDYPYEDSKVQNPELGVLGSAIMMVAFTYFLYRFWQFIRS